jgi:hypothetical protein
VLLYYKKYVVQIMRVEYYHVIERDCYTNI